MDYSMIIFFGMVILIFGVTILHEYITEKRNKMEETKCACGANVSCECGPKEETFKHEFKVLTTEEVMEGRSSAYEFIKFDNLVVKDLEYWRLNAEEDYITTPISVLRYIGELEKEIRNGDKG